MVNASRSAGMIFLVSGLVGCGQDLPGQTLEFRMRQGQPHPWQSTAYPDDQRIQVLADGAWNAKITGALATGCYTWKAACFKLIPTNGNPSGAGEAIVSFRGSGSETLAPGVHSGFIAIGAQTWQVRLTVLRRTGYLPFFYPEGYPKGCRNSNPQMPHADTCGITQEQPPENFTDLRTPGVTFKDPQFGNSVQRLTPSGFNVSYSTMRAFSALNTYVLTTTFDGGIQIWDRASSKKAGNVVGDFNIAFAVWDPVIDERLWFINGAQIGYRNVRTGQQAIVANYGSRRGTRPAFEKLDSGGTADNTDDNWWVFAEERQRIVCAVDLNGLTPANQEEHLYCASYASLGIQDVDFPQVTQVDSESNERYVLLLGTPHAQMFKVDQANHRLEHVQELSLTTPHSDVGQDAQGRQVFFWTWYDPHGDKNYIATAQLNKKDRMMRPVEEGGGLSLIYPVDTGGQRTDFHFGCNWTGYCVVSMYRDAAPETRGIPNVAISTIENNPACLVRTNQPHGYREGQSVVIGGSSIATLNGVSAIHVMDSLTFTLPGRSCPGRYEGGASVADAKRWSSDSPNRDEIVVVRLGGEVRRLAIHRTKIFADQGRVLNAYWSTPRASLSQDGRFVAFASNNGLPEASSVFVAEAERRQEIKRASVEAGARAALLRWEGAEAVTLLVSAAPDLEELVFSYRHFDGEVPQRWIDGLEPDTEYFYQILGENSSWFGSFRTRPEDPNGPVVSPAPPIKATSWTPGEKNTQQR